MPTTTDCDILITGSSGGGMMAAQRCLQRGHNVAMIDWTPCTGGAAMNLGLPDYVGAGANDTLWGNARSFFQRVETAAIAYGATSATYGYHPNGLIRRYLPEWARTARDQALAGVTVIRDIEIASVTKDPTTKIASAVTLTNGNTITFRQAGEGSYELDMLRLCGVPMRQGRSQNIRTFNERQAGLDVADAAVRGQRIVRSDTGKLWTGMQYPPRVLPGEADLGCMADDWRMGLDSGPNRSPFDQNVPAWYRREDYLDWADQINLQNFNSIENITSGQNVTDTQMTCNGGEISGFPWAYPEMTTKAKRLAFWEKLYRILYGRYIFAATDSQSPSDLKTSMAAWGLPTDQNQTEYYGRPGWPSQPYLREGSTPIMQLTMSFQDILSGASKVDRIGRGGYNADGHAVNFYPLPMLGSVLEGGVDDTGRGYYDIPLRCKLPHPGHVRNVVDCGFGWSCTSTAYRSLRMEPTSMVCGDAMGMLLSLAIELGVPATEVPYGALLELLTDANAAI